MWIWGIIGRKSKAAPNKEENTTVWPKPLEGGRGGIFETGEEKGKEFPKIQQTSPKQSWEADCGY